MFLRKKFFLTSIAGFAIFVSLVFFPKIIKGWFGAGETPGWPPTTTGLNGLIALPQYKFSPDFYNVGDTVNINVQGINPTESQVSSDYYLVINKVIQSPKGVNISDGTPNTPGINENDLNANHQAGNDVQIQVANINLGKQIFPAKGNKTFGGSYLTNQPGYFQFDFIDLNLSSQSYQPGHILAAGFFRVLEKQMQSPSPCITITRDEVSIPCPTISPSPSPTVTPTPAPTSTSAPTNNSNSSSGEGSVGAPQCNNAQPPAPTLLSVTKISSTSVKLVWTGVTPVTYYSISYGTTPGSNQFGVPNVGNSTSFTVGALNPNQIYYFTIRAVNVCAPSDPSNQVSSNGNVLGTSTNSQVLGASTVKLANTGSFETARLIASVAASLVVCGILSITIKRKAL